MDGDGSIANFVHAPTVMTYPAYRYERLIVSFNSASREHLDWLRAQLSEVIGDTGSLNVRHIRNRHDMFRLQYGKYATVRLLRLFYADPTAPRHYSASGASGRRMPSELRSPSPKTIDRIRGLAEVVKR